MKDFLKMMFACIAGLLVFCVAGFFLMTAALIGIAAVGEKQPVMPREAVLQINFDNVTLAEQTQEADPISMLTGGEMSTPLGIYSAITAINAAAEDPAVKAEFDSTMREIIAAAGELGSTGVIMVPAFNGQTPCKPHTRETREYLCEQMHELGEFALKHNTTVILEPLNRREAHYLRQVADAAAICRDSKSAGVKCMGDFWHMSEETSDYAALLAAGPEYLQHVHIASRGNRKMPGENGEVDNYVDGFRALKQMGYDKYVSFECGCNGDKEILVPAAVELLRSQWELA